MALFTTVKALLGNDDDAETSNEHKEIAPPDKPAKPADS
jgi:hypothetical protein